MIFRELHFIFKQKTQVTLQYTDTYKQAHIHTYVFSLESSCYFIIEITILNLHLSQSREHVGVLGIMGIREERKLSPLALGLIGVEFYTFL